MTGKTSLILAEDEAMLRVLAVEMLEEAGFHVLEAADGMEGLELLKAHPEVSLLVSDIKMPRMDGYALAEAGLALKPGLKVLLMTGYAQEPPPALLRQAEVQILHKPFNLERLCALAAELTQA
jgi:CheY-like chemotaxis protein